MPVIASVTFPIFVSENHTIDLLVLDEINSCGCINIKKSSDKLGVPLSDLQKTVEQLVGEQKIECDSNHVICCVNKQVFDDFVKNLKQIPKAQ